ncbi:PLC-like phosphodiesterase [Aspergillus multicolor]|uniref:PLC-like phosphodiesterase n=1 Tax=Aspergillus multicolor TaxID=41759 RepID=UPI003CCD22CC
MGNGKRKLPEQPMGAEESPEIGESDNFSEPEDPRTYDEFLRDQAREEAEQRRHNAARDSLEELLQADNRKKSGESSRKSGEESRKKTSEESRRKSGEEARKKTSEESRRKSGEEARKKTSEESRRPQKKSSQAPQQHSEAECSRAAMHRTLEGLDTSHGEALREREASERPPRPRFPQVIARRGFASDTIPENTILAFQAAVEAGAHAIETNIHMSREGIPVLTHDKSLKRCFGVRRNVKDVWWSELALLRTLGPTPAPMPRLTDLLHFLNQPDNQHIWVLLDVKMCTNLRLLLPALNMAFARVPAAHGTSWKKRIVIAVWKAGWLKESEWNMKEFKLCLSAWSPTYADAVLDEFQRFGLPLDCSLKNYTFESERGELVRAKHRQKYPNSKIFSWPDDSDLAMARSIRNGVDGVICADPLRFFELCREWEEDEAARVSYLKPSWYQQLQWLYWNVIAHVIEFLLLIWEGRPHHRINFALKGFDPFRRRSITMPNET